MNPEELAALLDGGLEERAVSFWEDFCRLTAEDACVRAPAGSGVLRGSMRCEVSRTGDLVTGVISFSAGHAVFVHEGTGRYHPNGRRTRWVYPVERDGALRFFSTEGQPPIPFLRDAVRAAGERLKEGVF